MDVKTASLLLLLFAPPVFGQDEMTERELLEAITPRGTPPQASDFDSPFIASKNIRRVVAVGIGLTPEDALERAFVSAVESAIGLLVDAKTIVENDELIEDKILTYSNGFVSRKQEKHLHHVKINAEVMVEALGEKLQTLSVRTSRALDGASLAAEATTKAKARDDLQAMVAEVTKGFPATVLKSEVGKPNVGTANDRGFVGIEIPITIKVDQKKYAQFDKQFRRVISQAAKSSRTRTLTAHHLTSDSRGFTFQKLDNSSGVKLYSFPDSIHEIHYGHSLRTFPRDEVAKLETFGVMLFDRAINNPSSTRWTIYELNKDHRKLFDGCTGTVPAITVRLIDGSDRVLSEQSHPGSFSRGKTAGLRQVISPWNLTGTGKLTPYAVNVNLVIPESFERLLVWPQLRENDALVQVFPIGPFFSYNFQLNGALFSPEVRFVTRFEMRADDLQKVESVVCEISMSPEDQTFGGTK